MTKIVTAAEANRQFSSLMRQVAEGETVIVTSHGRQVMTMTPTAGEDEAMPERRAAHRRLMDYLRSQPQRPGVTWTRQELYEDEPYPDTFK
ncbi:MAG: type II toxin-antitoxin system prevent-host-death family antitoxin [Ancalomicrobiaceae bacterium]|nr:type II toxin-antitoxin system prevent-host-death family antitoxin [Ancalomicrobiaceae bacterium]